MTEKILLAGVAICVALVISVVTVAYLTDPVGSNVAAEIRPGEPALPPVVVAKAGAETDPPAAPDPPASSDAPAATATSERPPRIETSVLDQFVAKNGDRDAVRRCSRKPPPLRKSEAAACHESEKPSDGTEFLDTLNPASVPSAQAP